MLETQLIKKSTKKSMMLEFKSNHSIKRKCLKWNVKKNIANNIIHEKHTIRNKTDKNWSNVLYRMYHKK